MAVEIRKKILSHNFDKIKCMYYFETIPLYHLKYDKESYEQAALINIKCRQNGITIRSTINLLIAETAIENNLYLLHNDSDFINMAKVMKELKLYE